jgi:hypothetical protein
VSNQLHPTLEEAIANAPVEPIAAYYEMNPLGPPEAKRAQLRAAVRQAVDVGLKVEILAAEETLADAHMSHLREFEGAAIHPGPADPPGYFRIKVCRAIAPRPAGA